MLNREFEYEAHVKGKRHMKELRKRELIEEAEGMEGGASKYVTINPATSRRMCTLCSVEFSSLMIEQTHLNGKRHQKNIKKINSGESISVNATESLHQLGRCEACNVNYISQMMKNKHLAGNKHIRNSKLRAKLNRERDAKKPRLDPPGDTAAPGVTSTEVVKKQSLDLSSNPSATAAPEATAIELSKKPSL